MVQKIAKRPIQVLVENEEWPVIKSVSSLRNFRSLNAYIKHLIEKDVVEYKKSLDNPWLVGMRKYDWDLLTEREKEQYLNQIGPVKPGGLEYMIDKIKGKIYDDIPVMGGENELI